jgi:rhamnogalacturonyl hydrolase YesR
MQNIDKIEASLDKVLEYADNRNYQGYNKYDALDSKLLMTLSFGSKFLRLVYSQVVMRFPINIRPVLFVPKTRNPKGIALFAMAYMNKYKAKKDQKDLQKAEELLDWLIKNPSSNKWGNCWGYQHPWQDVGFFAPAHLPNRVVTFFVLTAMLDAYEITGNEKYLTVAKNAVPFIKDAPKVLFEDENMKAMSYVPVETINWIVMDVSILAGSILARINKYLKDEEIAKTAKKLVAFVVDKQTDYGAWYYTHPAGDHPRQHDNYHTGYIIDAIYDYTKHTGDESFMPAYLKGLDYYIKNLFLEDGTPKWENNKLYPIDVHGSAQGIISFIKAAEFDDKYRQFALKIADWTIDKMQNQKKGFFYYQKTRFFRKPFTLMRWSCGWMSRGLSCIVYDNYNEK